MESHYRIHFSTTLTTFGVVHGVFEGATRVSEVTTLASTATAESTTKATAAVALWYVFEELGW